MLADAHYLSFADANKRIKQKRRMIMATSTRAIAAGHAIESEEPKSGVFERAFRRFVAAREARARIIAYQHLAHLSDRHLLDLGFEPAEIRKMRAYTGTSPVYWG